MKPSNLSLIAGLLIICLICAVVPAVSAETFEIQYNEPRVGSDEYSVSITDSRNTGEYELFYITDSKEKYTGLRFLSNRVQSTGFYKTISGNSIYAADNIPIRLYADSGRTISIGSALISWDTSYNILGSPIRTDTWVNFDNFEYNKLSGSTIYFEPEIPSQYFRLLSIPTGNIDNSGSSSFFGNIYLKAQSSFSSGQFVAVYAGNGWENTIFGTHSDAEISHIDLIRNGNKSNFTVYYGSNVYIQDYSNNNISRDIPAKYYTYVIVSSLSGTEYTDTFDPIIDTGPTISVLASVLSTADDALIGGATLNFNSTSHNVSQTLTSGYGLYTLYPGVEYTVSASADNYQEELSTNPTIIFGGDSRYDYYLKPVYGVENGTVQLNFYVSTANTAGSGYLKVPNALITLNSASTLITNDAGYAYATLNRSGSISYTIRKEGYKTYSRSFTPNWETWSSDTFEEYVTLLAEGAAIGNITPTPTPDTRDYNQKAESAFSLIFDNIEGISELAVVVLILSLIGMMTGGGKKK